MIKFLAKATSLFVLIFLATGCATAKPPVVKQGTTQYPSEIKPLIFVNFSIKSELYCSFPAGMFSSVHGELPWRVSTVWIENEKTHKGTGLLFNRNILVPGSMDVPYKVDSNTVYTSAFITLPPGDYIIDRFNIELATPAAGSPPPWTVIYLEKEPLRFTVPDKDFCSLGTVSIEMKNPEKKATFRNMVGDWPFKQHIALRPISPPEKDFAVQSYPFLKNLNLTP